MNRGLDARWFVVHELVAGSAVPIKREYLTLVEAQNEIGTRLYDDLGDGAMDLDFRAAVLALVNGALEIEWGGTRWWVSEEHEETGW